MDVSKIDMSTTLLGQRVALPVCIAPASLLEWAHREGICDTATLNFLYLLHAPASLNTR